MFSEEAKIQFLQEPNLKAYIETAERYLRETSCVSLIGEEAERYARVGKHVRLAKELYNRHIEDGILVSYKCKTPYVLD